MSIENFEHQDLVQEAGAGEPVIDPVDHKRLKQFSSMMVLITIATTILAYRALKLTGEISQDYGELAEDHLKEVKAHNAEIKAHGETYKEFNATLKKLGEAYTKIGELQDRLILELEKQEKDLKLIKSLNNELTQLEVDLTSALKEQLAALTETGEVSKQLKAELEKRLELRKKLLEHSCTAQQQAVIDERVEWIKARVGSIVFEVALRCESPDYGVDCPDNWNVGELINGMGAAQAYCPVDSVLSALDMEDYGGLVLDMNSDEVPGGSYMVRAKVFEDSCSLGRVVGHEEAHILTGIVHEIQEDGERTDVIDPVDTIGRVVEDFCRQDERDEARKLEKGHEKGKRKRSGGVDR
jgi:hypothetical protein